MEVDKILKEDKDMVEKVISDDSKTLGYGKKGTEKKKKTKQKVKKK